MKYYDFVDKMKTAIPPLVIIEGTERTLAEAASALVIARLRAADPTIAFEKFRAPSMDSFRPLAEGLVSLGFFSARKCMLVRDTHELRAAPRRALWEIAQTVCEPTVLILEDLFSPTKKTKPEPYGVLAGRNALRIDTTSNVQTRTRFIEDSARTAGVTIAPAALRALADGGAELAGIRSDVERLAMETQTIGVAMLAPESLGSEDPKAYKFAGALLEGNDAEAFRILNELFADDPRGAAVPILSALATEYGLLWEVARGNGGLPARHRWRERVLKPLAAKIGRRAARRGYERAIRGFEAVVTGRTDDPRILVETIGAECAYERAAAVRARTGAPQAPRSDGANAALR